MRLRRREPRELTPLDVLRVSRAVKLQAAGVDGVLRRLADDCGMTVGDLVERAAEIRLGWDH